MFAMGGTISGVTTIMVWPPSTGNLRTDHVPHDGLTFGPWPPLKRSAPNGSGHRLVWAPATTETGGDATFSAAQEGNPGTVQTVPGPGLTGADPLTHLDQ